MPRREGKDDQIVLQKDLKRDCDWATALDKLNRPMEVDLVGRSQNRCRLGVISGTLERKEAPPLDGLDLGLKNRGEVCG